MPNTLMRQGNASATWLSDWESGPTFTQTDFAALEPSRLKSVLTATYESMADFASALGTEGVIINANWMNAVDRIPSPGQWPIPNGGVPLALTLADGKGGFSYAIDAEEYAGPDTKVLVNIMLKYSASK